MKTQHTPTPLILRARGQNIFYEMDYTGLRMGRLVAECRNEKEAAFIVRAVNSHDELVRALKEVVAYVTECRVGGAPVIADARQTIARAEGKE